MPYGAIVGNLYTILHFFFQDNKILYIFFNFWNASTKFPIIVQVQKFIFKRTIEWNWKKFSKNQNFEFFKIEQKRYFKNFSVVYTEKTLSSGRIQKFENFLQILKKRHLFLKNQFQVSVSDRCWLKLESLFLNKSI